MPCKVKALYEKKSYVPLERVNLMTSEALGWWLVLARSNSRRDCFPERAIPFSRVRCGMRNFMWTWTRLAYRM